MTGQSIEVQKVACRQDRDGRWLVTVVIHPSDFDSDLVLSHPGTIFNLTFEESAVDRLLRAEEDDGMAVPVPATADEGES